MMAGHVIHDAGRRKRAPQSLESRLACRLRQQEKALAARRRFRAGTYVVGSYHRETTCEGCSKVFPVWRQQRMRFCSRECYGLDLIPADLARRRAERVREKRSIPKVIVVRHCSCAVCGALFDSRYVRKHCTAACALKAARSRYVRRPRTLARRSCLRCGKQFVGRADGGRGSKGQIFCSIGCNDRYHCAGGSNRKRARHYGVAYEPIKTVDVLERDSWRCQICGRCTPKRLRGSHDDRAPELDHRVPMVLGGTHTWDNVQCACRRCNQRKHGTRIAGQMQLLPRAMPSTAVRHGSNVC